MTETNQLSMGDYIAMHDGHHYKKPGNTIATVIGIGVALLVIAFLWHTFSRRHNDYNCAEKDTSYQLGDNGGEIKTLKAQVSRLESYERQDAIKIAYTDGCLHKGGYLQPHYQDYGYGGHCGHGGHSHYGHGDCTKTNFKEVKTFTPTTDEITVTTVCN
jgi:hypothetical protein